jgi:hypothetical protein
MADKLNKKLTMNFNMEFPMKKLILLAGLLISFNSYAHEGHDHDAPGMVEAPKGGMIKSNEEFHIEVVAKGKDIKVYLYTKDLKPADAKGFKITLKTELPRSKKMEDLSFKATGNMLEATFDAKGAHRYNLIVGLTEVGQGHEHGHADKISFTIEPRK